MFSFFVQDLLNRYWTSDELDPNEQFLRDFILKKHYIDHDDDQYDFIQESCPNFASNIKRI